MKSLLSIIAVLLGQCLYAQTVYLSLPAAAKASELRAAERLQFYLGKMTGAPVLMGTPPTAVEGNPLIFIGQSLAAKAFGFQIPERLEEDAYFLEGKKGAFALSGGGEMGAEYAVYTLLELLGCRKFSPRDSFISHPEKLQLPDYQARVETPAFPYRELWYEPAFDESWARWHKLKTNPKKNEEWGMFVHTFDKLCPQEKYFETHPEYFAFNGAQRSAGQLCLANDTVFEIVVSSLREQIRQKPKAKYWSVSQNDNYDYCKCSRCAALDGQHGGPAASLIQFVNRVAAQFPDKTISTLAYQYTRQAPKGIQPAANVNICLCSIECNRGQSIEEGCPDFARDVREWSALTQNLMIWDYVVQFRSYLGPFPNWHTLQPNLQFFQQNGVKMMFEQGSGHDRSEFSDMRAYLLAKLMWNPKANMDSILTDFGDGYYGNARAGVWAHIDDQTQRLRKHGNRLWIYDVPQNEPFVMDGINRRFFSSFTEQFPRTLDSVERERILPIYLSESFSFLEHLKCIPPLTDDAEDFEMRQIYMEMTQMKEFLDDFEQSCSKAGIGQMHENRYSPKQYVQDYKAFVERSLAALFSGTSTISLEKPASATYAKGNPEELINKLVGETDYRYNWLGFQGQDMQATVGVLDSQKDLVSTIQVSFLQDQSAWVFYPEKVLFEISTDGNTFIQVQEEKIEILPDAKKAFRTVQANFQPIKGLKAIRVTAFNQKNCPSWHTCNGNPSWIFADEIIIR